MLQNERSDASSVTETELEDLAFHNAEEFQKLKSELIRLRMAAMTQNELGDRLGISQSAVAQIESASNSPRLSTLRAYALAVGARVAISVEPDKTVAVATYKMAGRTNSSKGFSGHSVVPSQQAKERVASNDFVLAA